MKKCCKDPLLSDPGIFNDPDLLVHGEIISSRRSHALALEDRLKKEKGSVRAFADLHEFFGLHFQGNSWLFRERAPHARQMFILCSKTGWQPHPDFELQKIDDQVFERHFPRETFSHQDLYRLKILWPGGGGDRIPTLAIRVVQDPLTLIFNGQVWHPDPPYVWKLPEFFPSKDPLLIYETHVGMALEENRIGSYGEFERHILPKIVEAGYTAIQFMAIQEHPYYASFGYHVANFFAVSSRFGTPDEFKSLVDAAHAKGIRVLMDIIHSHAVNNEVEGIAKFDGTVYQFFHDGPRGYHRQWDSRCFNYGKKEVLGFLLSNLKFWVQEYKIDGFRFDGITSMLFEDHGLARAFTRYEDYYGPDVDVDALSYLCLANSLVHDLNPRAITIAEDVSGYPGLAAPVDQGGTGFDFRYAMGIADFWIKLLKEVPDERWPLGTLWHELTTRRSEEKTISYAESHDQALVGDQTLMMRLMGHHIYSSMEKTNTSIETHRGVALHKMIRLITLATAGSGYLNFMGNEFGHPEWVDFPCARNHFSFVHARRQWSLKYDKNLYFSALFEFDKQMILLAKVEKLFDSSGARLLYLHEDHKIMAFERNQLIFIFNFHPARSFEDYRMEALPGRYQMIFNSDDPLFGGKGRLDPGQVHFTLFDPVHGSKKNSLSLYLPSRTAMVLTFLD